MLRMSAVTCSHGCRRCERSQDIQTLAWIVILSIAVSAAIQYWYVSGPLLLALLVFLWLKHIRPDLLARRAQR